MIRNNDYFEIIKEQNKELAKFRPFKSAYEMKQEIKRLNNIIKEARQYVKDTPKIVKSIHLRNKESNFAFIENEVKNELLEILDKENKNE